MMQHLPILQVIIPLLAAPACLIFNRPRAAWFFALIASAAAMATSILLLQQVINSGTISYMLGGWDAPWGIEYRIDSLNAYVLLIVSSISTLVMAACYRSVAREIPERKLPLYFSAYLLCFAGLLGIAATGDAFNVFVFLEISSLATYALIAMGHDKRALWASYRYLVMGTIGATFILIGIGLMYVSTGTLNMLDLAERLPQSPDANTIMTAFAFMIVGICLKLAMFPLHLWLPNAYTYAPSMVTVFLAATATKVAVYLLIRFCYTVFGWEVATSIVPLNAIFLILGLVGVISASLVAVFQDNVKRLFAYSSVAQIGYMVVGIGIGTAIGLQATLLHLFNHALMKGALFMALAAVMYRIGTTAIADFKGLGKRMPWTSAAIVLGGLSLIGVPLTVGFVSKWYLVLAALDVGAWYVAALVLIGSLIALFYVWRIIEIAYLTAPDPDRPAQSVRGEAPLSILIPTWLLVAANIYFGIDTRLTISVTKHIANALAGGGL